MKCSNIYCFLVVAITFMLSAPCASIQAMEQDPTISFDLKNTPLSNVVEDISRQIQYQITLDKKCGNPNLSGTYENLPLEKLFTRLLKNTIILIDYDDQVIHLDCIGSVEDTPEFRVVVDRGQKSAGPRLDLEDSQANLGTEELSLLEVAIADPMPVPKPTSEIPLDFNEMVDSETGLTFSEMEKQLKIKIN